MIKTKEDIKMQIQKLFDKHPSLDGFSFIPLRDHLDRHSIEDVSNLMDLSWKDTYKSQERFNYSPEYLKWVFGNEGLHSDLSIAAMDDGKLIGVVLFTPRTIMIDGVERKTGIETGLSIHPDAKAKGLGRMMFLKSQEIAQREYGELFYWLHKTVSNRYSSYKIQTGAERNFVKNWGNFPMKSAVFDYSRVTANVKLFPHEKLAMKIFARSDDVGVDKVDEVDDSNLEWVVQQLNERTLKKGYGRIFGIEEFSKYVGLASNNLSFKPVGYISSSSNSLKSIAVGYPIEVIGKNVDLVFFLDYWKVFEESSRRFVGSVEKTIKSNYGVYGIITPEQSLGLIEGYLPSRSILTCCSIPFSDEALSSSIQSNELILDHK